MGVAGRQFVVDGRKVNRSVLVVFAVSTVLFAAHYGKQLIVNPFLAEYHVRKGDNFCRSTDLGDERLDEAKKQYSRAASLDPTFTWAYWRLARIHEMQGEDRQALATLRRMKRILPGCEVLLENIRFLRTKLALRRIGRDPTRLLNTE